MVLVLPHLFQQLPQLMLEEVEEQEVQLELRPHQVVLEVVELVVQEVEHQQQEELILAVVEVVNRVLGYNQQCLVVQE